MKKVLSMAVACAEKRANAAAQALTDEDLRLLSMIVSRGIALDMDAIGADCSTLELCGVVTPRTTCIISGDVVFGRRSATPLGVFVHGVEA